VIPLPLAAARSAICWRACGAALAIGAMFGCAAGPERSIVGVWRSDAARTLASMQSTPGIPDDVRATLADDYYGHLVIEYRAATVRARFDNSDYDSGERPYRVAESTPEYVVTEEWNEILREFETSTTYFDGECIYAVAAQYAFREYYCPAAE
jgi:hypothetical protein